MASTSLIDPCTGKAVACYNHRPPQGGWQWAMDIASMWYASDIEAGCIPVVYIVTQSSCTCCMTDEEYREALADGRLSSH